MSEDNNLLTRSHIDDVIAISKDKFYYEDFHLHLKMFEIDKLKENTIEIELMLIELDSKHSNILRQK